MRKFIPRETCYLVIRECLCQTFAKVYAELFAIFFLAKVSAPKARLCINTTKKFSFSQAKYRPAVILIAFVLYAKIE